ncbi:hypothetical protein GN958_ATG06115 [Phytophthora infestans]|uniref:Uncharacterized protein n=1 Tax=Phytophthora infestans TaxID=4787 RepID=A0A8S9V2P6_PHYIN|nr:hypothetical protein GN958_ATG06115 [Phytophthora infestans]
MWWCGGKVGDGADNGEDEGRRETTGRTRRTERRGGGSTARGCGVEAASNSSDARSEWGGTTSR